MEPEKKTQDTGPAKGQRNRKDKRYRSKKQGKSKSAPKEGPNKPKNTLLPDTNRKAYHSNLPQLPVKRVEEPLEKCGYCGEVIETIASALTHPEGGFCHFDCVLSHIAEEEHVSDKQKVSYIGRGTFAVVEMNEDGTFTFVKRIVWENGEALDAMKKYVEGIKQ
ncbi:MAG: hypothetical protein GX315_10585 [Spirochaetales bacterium]|jgi:hypothetical protein|nr:hypothetical protein [Spirochaetales bacterium]